MNECWGTNQEYNIGVRNEHGYLEEYNSYCHM